MTTTERYCYRGYEIVPLGALVCQHLQHASRFTTHLAIYTADFGTTEGRGCAEAKRKIDRVLTR